MAGSGAHGSRGVILLAAVLVGASVVPSVVAAAEDETRVLPGITVTALTVDLDADGSREIVRLTQEAATVDYAVDAWQHDGERWSLLGSVALAQIGEPASPSTVGSGDAASLLLVDVAGRQRALALSAALVPGDPDGATCCLVISEVVLTEGGDLALRAVQRTDSGAQSFQAADLDGDGSDELVLHESRSGSVESEPAGTVRVLRWDGSSFAPIFEQTDRHLIFGFAVGDTDGIAGDDLLFGPGSDGRIRRLSWVDGGMRVDQSPIDAGEPPDGWIVGVADGAIVMSLLSQTRVLRWPRGAQARTVERLTTFGYPGVTLIGDGPDALVVVQDNAAFESGRPPSSTIHDLALRPLGEVGVGPATEGFWRMFSGQAASGWSIQRNIYPYSGPIHGGLMDGRSAYASSGILIQPGGTDGYEARPMSSLIGVQPIGLAGPRDAWVAAGGYGAAPGAAYLSWGGVPPEWGRLTVMPLASLLRPDHEVNGASVELIDAVEVAAAENVAGLMAQGDGFHLAITAPAGSGVVVVNGPLTEEHEVGQGPLVVDIDPPRNRQQDENVAFELLVLIVTPGGRGITEQWTGTFVREPPELSVRGSTDAMALSATLTGRASPGSTVTANGAMVDADGAGRFAISIDAPIWPTRVVVNARDALGNEAMELVEVVGVVDYRGLPWGAIVVGATLVVGGLLYVRTPKRRLAAARDGDGRLEELELDPSEGTDPSGR